MALTPWQKHVQKTLRAGGTMKDASRTFKKAGKATKKSRSTRRTVARSPAPRASSRKPAKKSTRSKGAMERKRIAFKKEFDDIARALGVPLSKTTFKIVQNTWSLKAGKVKAKAIKLSKAMRLFKQRARNRL